MKKEIKLKTGTRKTSVSRAKVSEVIQDIKDMAWTEEKVHRFNEYKPLTHVEVKSTEKQKDILKQVQEYALAKEKAQVKEHTKNIVDTLKTVQKTMKRKCIPIPENSWNTGMIEQYNAAVRDCVDIIERRIKKEFKKKV